jgi:hypothetical protein
LLPAAGEFDWFAEPMMRSSAISILVGQLLALSGFALTDATPHPSPDGKFLIANVGDTAEPTHHFELRRSDGFVLFSFKGSPGFDLPSFAEDISWSDGGEFVALSVSTGKYLQDTLIIATASGKAIKVQTHDSDYQTRPIRWTRRGELIVETKAPYGGKADDDLSWARYQYRRTFRIRGGGLRVERVYTGPIVFPYRAELLRDGYKPRHGATANPALHRRATGFALFSGGDSSRPWPSVSFIRSAG